MHPVVVKKLELLYLLLSFSQVISSNSLSQNISTGALFCGRTQIQAPLNRMILCRSQKLYFRTSLGLFPVSSIDYTSKTLTIIISSCSSSSSNLYVSPSVLSAGFPSQPNSLLLFNCSNSENHPISSLARNCSSRVKYWNACAAAASDDAHNSCLEVDDIGELDKVSFHPKDLGCSHYIRVYRTSWNGDEEGYEMGTRISFDIIPDHPPNPCNECDKPNGNCGVGLRCLCHPQECKDKVISVAESLKAFGNVGKNMLLSALCFILVHVLAGSAFFFFSPK